MGAHESGSPVRTRPLRLWPGVVVVVVQWSLRFVVPVFAPEAVGIGVLAGLLGGLGVVAWWGFFSRAPRGERLGGVLVMVLALLATPPFLHESVATGMEGWMFAIYAFPTLALGFVAWAVATRALPDRTRRATMVATVVIACGGWALVRTGGFTGGLDHDLAWRWSATPEERLLAAGEDAPVAAPSAVPRTAGGTAEGGTEWPGFRGPGRAGVVRGVRIATDWSASPPEELWRRPVGPGWSSFAVGRGRFFTQEQRGDDEVVSCHDMETGAPVWRHRDAARFWESNAGAGPRGTPTLHGGRVIALGATGILNVLAADDGSVAWSRDAAADTGAEQPQWGFSGSPLVVGDLVVVAAAGALIAYDLASGEPRWSGPTGGDGYSSPQLLTIDGVEQIVFLSEAGATGVAPDDGARLWDHAWAGGPIVQPARTAEGDVLVSVTGTSGLRRLGVAREPGGWSVVERWTSIRLKPYFSDYVLHAGHAYGFDGGRLACIELEGGQRRWKGGRYGHGQLLLLADQALLLVLSEEGELALVEARADGHAELARFPAIEGKTWNHPVLAGDVLLVRNAQEMAAFRLSLLGG